MAEFNFDTKAIDYLINKVDTTTITRLKIKSEGLEIEIESKPAPIFPSAPFPASPTGAGEAYVPGTVTEAAQAELCGNIIKSPIVGTFYSASSPENPPFVEVGQKISKGDVVCIVESMKLMNEIKSEFDGTVTKILVENGESVDYNCPIMVIE